MTVKFNKLEKSQFPKYKEIFGDWTKDAVVLHALYKKYGTKDIMYIVERLQDNFIPDAEEDAYTLVPRYKVKQFNNE